MAKSFTPILNLEKHDTTEYYDILMHAANMDKVEHGYVDSTEMKTAGGTGTAIMLTMPSITAYRANQKVSFVASANNGGASTTLGINALAVKPVYKANTTTPPNFVSGKAYELWFSESGDCFFLKASAEGTAQASHVLASETFSNDADTGIQGTMVNRGQLNVTPSDTDQNFSDGYYPGITVYARPTLSGTVAASEVLSSKTFYGASYTKQTGSMPNRGAISQSIAVNGSYTIPEGYHNGSGVVSQSLATKGAETFTPGTTNQTIASGQYLSGTQTIAGDADLVSANIKSGANIFGVAGNSNVVDTSAGDATAAQILSGKKAYVDGTLVTGTIASKTAQTFTPGTANQTIAAGQYLSGTQTIAGDADLVASKIVSTANIFGVQGSAIEGRRRASGTYNGTSYNAWTISGLAFTPSYIIIEGTFITTAEYQIYFPEKSKSTSDGYDISEIVISLSTKYSASSTNPSTGEHIQDMFTINTDGFTNQNGVNGQTFKWIAIE